MTSERVALPITVLWLVATTFLCLVPLLAPVKAAGSGLAGTITDMATGAAISGAAVSAGSARTLSDAQGAYTLALPPGKYDVRVESPAYIGMTVRFQQVIASGQTTLNIAMVPATPTPIQAAAIERALLRPSEEPSAETARVAMSLDVASKAVTKLPATIRVLMPDGSVQTMAMDEYLRGVVPQEVAPYWPREALKAQAVAARSFAATRQAHAEVGADVCTTSHCQAWSPICYDSTDQAVAATSGMTLRYNEAIAHAFYFMQCDGHTRNSEEVWGGYLPYARSVSCPYHEGGVQIGHGVGMCQAGARALAEQGWGYVDILKHYYTGCQVLSDVPPSLESARVTPATGDQGTLFSFEVTYVGGLTPPAVANVVIDGLSHSLLLVESSGHSRLYRFETYLPTGGHTYRFYFDDGQGQVLRAPGSGSISGPSVSAGGTPPAISATDGTRVHEVTHSTPEDWATGTFEGTQVSAQGDGALSLQAGRQTGTYTSGPLSTDLAFVAVGISWHPQIPGGSQISLELRTSADSRSWTPWMPVKPDEDMDDGPVYSSSLIFGEGQYMQYRATLRAGQQGEQPALENIRLTGVDSRDGPQASELAAMTRPHAAAMPAVINRAGWGANEAYMTAPLEYRPVQAVIIHHTATTDGGVDPAAIVRAVYYYHAVTREWGDIGYNFLIDKYGNVYEGRYGGPGVVGHHAGWYNYGSVGISLVGNFDDQQVPAAMLSSLTDLLGSLCSQHSLDPLSSHFFIDKVLPTIMGHRDVGSTTCPGRYAYALLPQIRNEAKGKMAQPAPRAEITSPRNGEQVSGVVTVAVGEDPNISSVEYYVDDTSRANHSQPPLAWKWNTTEYPDGPHNLRVVTRNAAGQAEASITVQVDNTPPTGTVSAPAWSASTYVPFWIQAQGATEVQFSNVWLWEAENLQHQSGVAIPDGGALNGIAWQAGAGDTGFWFGPYTLDLPPGQDYEACFRLKTPQHNSTSPLARLDVADNQGHRVYAERSISGDDFIADNTYQEFCLRFHYEGTQPTWEGLPNGLEFRVELKGGGELIMDRVIVFGGRRSLAPGLFWNVPATEGKQVVTTRLLDAAGNYRDVQVTVSLDLSAPKVITRAAGKVTVQDSLSGLDTRSAQYTYSSDKGFSWSQWRPIPLDKPLGTKEQVTIEWDARLGEYVRVRVKDVAGNVLDLPPTSPLPELRLEPGQRISPFFPLVFRTLPR